MEFIRKNTWKLLIVLAFFLPVLPKQAPIVLGLTVILSLIYSISQRKLNTENLKEIPNKLSLLFFAICLISLLYSSNLEHGIKELEIKLSFLIFPLLSLILPISKNFKPLLILKSFALSCLVLLIVSLGFSFSHQLLIYIKHEELYWGYYFGDYLVHTLHKGYFGIYMLLASLIFLYTGGITKNKTWRKLYFLCSAITLIGVYLSTAKGALLASAFSYLLVGFFIFSRYYNLKKLLLFTSTTLIITIAGITFLNNETTNRIRSSIGTITSFNKINPEDHGSTNLRLMAWSGSIETIKKRPIIGFGIGDANEELNYNYKELNYNYPAKINLDSHNQFFATAIQTGIIGSFILLSYFILSIVWFSKKKDLLGCLIVTTFIIFSLIESSFETQAGIMVFHFLMISRILSSQKTLE